MAEKPICPSCNKRIVHREGLDWCMDHQMSEATLQNRVVARGKRRGYVIAHAGKGWVGDQETGAGQFVTPMLPGWPDLFFLKPTARYPAFWMELKREDGVVSEDQWRVMRLLVACGIPGGVVRPSDLRLGRVNTILDGR